MHISVIGGGVVGLSTAYWLCQHGCTVTLFERNSAVGMGASYANGGQLSYNYVAPLAQAEVWKDLPLWLLKKDSPLHFSPQFDVLLWLQLLKQQVQNTFPFIDVATAQPWVGLRPTTPTSKPIITRCPTLKNAWLNIGHGALGFTLASGSAALVGAMVLDQPPPIDPSPFALQ